MKKTIKATIYYNMTENHPDLKYCDSRFKHEFTDTYYVDTDNYFSEEDMLNHIKSDLTLVAGGGYNTKEIEDVIFKINGCYSC